MNIKAIYEARREALRFYMVVNLAIVKIESDGKIYITGSKETAAAKRASMDLTRALAEMRRA